MNTLYTLAQSGLDYTYSTGATRLDDETTAAVAGAFFFVFFIALVVIYIITAIFLGKIFKKAGLASWPAWVPIYNTWKLLEIGGQPGFWAALGLITPINIVTTVFTYIAMYHVGKKLGKSGNFVLLAIFLPVVWVIWLATDKSVWDEKLSDAPSRATGPTPEGAKAA